MQYYSVKGIVLALVSGTLFTANNFLVNLYSVSACHLVLVRSLLQMLVYSAFCLAKSEPLLPGPPKQKMLILLQGWLVTKQTLIFESPFIVHWPFQVLPRV